MDHITKSSSKAVLSWPESHAPWPSKTVSGIDSTQPPEIPELTMLQGQGSSQRVSGAEGVDAEDLP
jgi:hypothetical protein